MLSNVLLLNSNLITYFAFPMSSISCYFDSYTITDFLVVYNKLILLRPAYNHGDFFILYQIFLAPQVKQSMITSNRHGVYKLPHKLLGNLRLRILGN